MEIRLVQCDICGKYYDNSIEAECPYCRESTLQKDTNNLASPVKNELKPVVGWIVVLNGPDMGKDFRLVCGDNYIEISYDSHVAVKEKQKEDLKAVITFDTADRRFFIYGINNTSIYINEIKAMDLRILKNYDIIKINFTELLFVPLCNDYFNWKAADKC